MEISVQAIFQAHFEAYAETHAVPLPVKKAGWALMACRTTELGGHIQACPEGHVEGVWYNSCKHRSCPQCNQIQMERWLDFQKARLLAGPHRHLIFTLPHELNALWQWNDTVMSDLLFQAVRETVMELRGDERYVGALPGLVCALHTWGRSLALHPHLHCLITEGGLDEAGHWQAPRKGCFLPARVVMALFRGQYLASLGQALDAGELRLPRGETLQRVRNLLNKLGRKKWNVRVGERYAHGEGVVTYLACYVKGGPLKNSQLQAVTETTVTFRYSPPADQPDGERRRAVNLTLSSEEFIRRYLQHVPEPGRQRVRSYGLYAHGKRVQLDIARAQWQQAPVVMPTFRDWQTYYERVTGQREATHCPVCGCRLVARVRVARPPHDPPARPGFTYREAA
jgi:hypothetical protein